MKGVTKNFTNGQLEVMAFKAGNDILLLSENVEKSISYLMNALRSQEISETDLNEKVIRILKAKYRVGLDRLLIINPDNIETELKNLISHLSKRNCIVKQLLYKRSKQ